MSIIKTLGGRPLETTYEVYGLTTQDDNTTKEVFEKSFDNYDDARNFVFQGKSIHKEPIVKEVYKQCR